MCMCVCVCVCVCVYIEPITKLVLDMVHLREHSIYVYHLCQLAGLHSNYHISGI